MTTSFDDFMAYQIEHQVHHPRRSPYRKPLGIEGFKKELEAMDDVRYAALCPLILENTLDGLQELKARGLLSYLDLTRFYFKRIFKLDEHLCAFITLNRSAFDQARQRDREYTGAQGPLYGMPMALKDNIGTGDGLPNTAGCACLGDFIPARPAGVASRLLKAGAIIIGKTNLSQWAFYMSSEGVCGYSALGGQCRNPLGPYGVGGSSSGSAVAVTANLCAAAIGTETSGSIIHPSGQNGIAGLYPGRGTWPNDGIIPLSPRLDTPGPMGRHVVDLIRLHEVVSGRGSVLLDPASLRLGLVSDASALENGRGDDPAVFDRLEEEWAGLKMRPVRVELDKVAYEAEMTPLLDYDFNRAIAEYFRATGAPYKDLEPIVERYRQEPLLAPYGFDLLEKSLRMNATPEEDQALFRENLDVCRNALDKVFETVDVLITLSSHLSGIYATAGYPTLTVPAGVRPDGEPVGMTLTTSPGGEDRLFALAGHYEQHRAHRKMWARILEKIG